MILRNYCNIYFFDTYAIMELMEGSPVYEPYKQARPVIAIFNLLELHYAILRERGKELANRIAGKYRRYVVSVPFRVIKSANEFRYKHRKQRISAPDAVGYMAAKHYSIRFLTGDKQFRDMENVEFVK